VEGLDVAYFKALSQNSHGTAEEKIIDLGAQF
jgi:hypothetical protein